MKIFVLAFLLLAGGVYAQDSPTVGTNIGDTAPEIKLKNADGEEVALSSLRGKVVLIDFWASWCGPCRRENPSVVKAFKAYGDKNFTIGKNFTVYGVSLDKNKASWIQAIEKDQLTWTNVTDLQYWNSAPAKEYGVRGIPSNFLIDANGVIIEKNLRGAKLETTLEKYIKVDPLETLKASRDGMLKTITEMKEDEYYVEQIKLLEKIETKMLKIDEMISDIKSIE